MSYKATMNKKVQLTEKKPFCKMCFDAKREGYDTHYLKDFTGPEVRVTCPYLLGLQCNYCKEQGHTISYCPILKMKGTTATKPTTKHQQYQVQKNDSVMTEGASVKIYSLHTEEQTPYPARDWLFDGNAYIRVPPPPRLVRQNAVAVNHHRQEDEVDDFWQVQSRKTSSAFKNTHHTQQGGGNATKTSNVYGTLFSDETEDEDNSSLVQAQTVATTAKIHHPQTESRLWAQIASKVPDAPAPIQFQKKRVQFQETIPAPLPELSNFNLKKKTPLSDAFFFKYTPSNWADDSSDEDEDA